MISENKKLDIINKYFGISNDSELPKDSQLITENTHTSSVIDITYKIFHSNIHECYFITRYVIRDDRLKKYPFPFQVVWIHFNKEEALHHFEDINKPL